MPLESATYIGDLSPTNPTGPDDVSGGDNHLRLLKSVLQQTFPNASKAFRFPTAAAIAITTVAPTFPTDQNKLFPVNASGGSITVNLPDPTSGGTVNEDGFSLAVIKTDSSVNAVVIDGSGSQTINGAATLSLGFQYQFAILVWNKLAAQWFAYVSGAGPDLLAIEAISDAGIGVLKKTAANTWALDSLDTTLNIAKDNGAVALSTGFFAEVQVDFACTIVAARLVGNPSGNAVMDVQRATFANYPTFASIAASAKPTLASAQKVEDTTLTGWTTTLAAGDWIRGNLDSVATCTRLGLSLKLRRFS